MQYYSTNKQAPDVTLEEAVVKGLAADKGLFMPFTIKPLPQEFYDSIDTLGFQEIAYRVADAFFGEDVPADTFPVLFRTLFVATIPVPASPSGGQSKIPDSKFPLISRSLAPSCVNIPARSPDCNTFGKISSIFQENPSPSTSVSNF